MRRISPEPHRIVRSGLSRGCPPRYRCRCENLATGGCKLPRYSSNARLVEACDSFVFVGWEQGSVLERCAVDEFVGARVVAGDLGADGEVSSFAEQKFDDGQAAVVELCGGVEDGSLAADAGSV